MIKRYLFFLLIILIFAGCSSEFDLFNEEALNLVKNDKKIDEKEFHKLINHITGSEEKDFQMFKNNKGEINDKLVASYLQKYFKAKDIDVTLNDIWQSKSIVSEEIFNVNVFLENSASMDGYVKGVTEFETAIYNLLGDIKISGVCDSLNLNYINKSIPFQKKYALSEDIQDFIEKLEPSSFKEKGGNRSVSDMSNILKTVLKTVNNKNAAVLISDFVFSPGKNTDANDYLNNQSVGIKVNFAEKLKQFDLSALVIQLYSNFDGKYYDKINNEIFLKCKRPYYIWIFGTPQQISSILKLKILENIKGGYSNSMVFQQLKESSVPKYKILHSPKIGKFSSDQLNQKIISDATASDEHKNKGTFGFSVAVDFSNSLQDEKYFLDTGNYVLSNNKYQLKSESTKNINQSSLSGFTHILKLQTNELRGENLKIDVVGKSPQWVISSTSTDDSNILNDNSDLKKTYGLKSLIDGVSDAFYPKSKSNVINSISITIKK